MVQPLTLKVYQTEVVLMLLKLLHTVLAMFLNLKLMLQVMMNPTQEQMLKLFGSVNFKVLTLMLMLYKLEMVIPLLTLGLNLLHQQMNTTLIIPIVMYNF